MTGTWPNLRVPVMGKAYVKSIGDGRYTVVPPMGQGYEFDTVPSVGLLIEGVDVTAMSGTMQPLEAQHMKLVMGGHGRKGSGRMLTGPPGRRNPHGN